jgi:AcrR family transcriptional regulator
MSLIDRREREKEQRRNSIIDAAETLFFSKGFAHTTMDDISGATELSKGTLYLYFKSKEELYFAIILRGMKVMKQSYETALSLPGCGLATLFNIGMAMLEFSRTYPNYFEAISNHNLVLQHFPANDNPLMQEMAAVSNDMFRLSTDALQSGIADGSIRPEIDITKVAFSLYGLVSGLIRTIKLEGDHMLKFHGMSPQDLVESSFELIGHALRNPHAPAYCRECGRNACQSHPAAAAAKTAAAKSAKKEKKNDQ